MADVLGFLKKVAPWTAQAISVVAPGPIGIVAGVVAKALGASASVKPTQESVINAITPLMATDEGRLKLAQIEADTAKAFNDLNIKSLDDLVALEQIDAADRNSARNMAIQKDIWTPRLLSVYVCTMASMLIWAVIKGKTKGIDALEAGTLGTILGYVFRDVAQVLNFWFGTSSGSEEKTKMISQLAQNGGNSGNH